jgi:hypothetical protein
MDNRIRNFFNLSTRSRFNKNLITDRQDFEDLMIRNSLVWEKSLEL